MKGFTPLILGILATLAFSWLGLAYIPDLQIGHLEPQSDEEGTDIYPMPRSGMAERGRRVYVANGCFYCHSQQIRADYAAADIDLQRWAAPSPRPKWGDRRSVPRDYIFDRPALIGKARLGPDLANIGKAAPVEEEAAPAQPAPAGSPGGSPAPANASPAPGTASPPPSNSPAQPGAKPPAQPSPAPAAGASPAQPSPATAASPSQTATSSSPAASSSESPAPYSAPWHHQHLYSPRSLNLDSDMPAYKFLYEKRRVGGEQSADALHLRGDETPEEGWEIVPTYDAKCLVAYLMSLNQSHALSEVKSAPAAAPAASPGATAQPAVKK
jgi:cbb3-type cytochrome oxidase cytochrome c subunit